MKMSINLKQFAMKKSTIFKIAMSFAAAIFLAGNIFAQNVPYTEMTGTSATVDSVTVGALMQYYVQPDPALNDPGVTAYDTAWNQATAVTNGYNSTWTWSWFGGSGGSIVTSAAWDAPYATIRITGTAGTLYTLEVYETQGSCNDGTPTQLSIRPVTAPTFTVNDVGHHDICNNIGIAGVDISISSFTETVGGGTLNLLADIDCYTDDGSLNFATAVPARTSADTVIKVAETSGTRTQILTGYYMSAQGGALTRYRINLGSSITSGSDNGVNDVISRKSDFFENDLDGVVPDDVTDFTFYAATDAVSANSIIEYWVYPEPQTGTIYYIPNDFRKN